MTARTYILGALLVSSILVEILHCKLGYIVEPFWAQCVFDHLFGFMFVIFVTMIYLIDTGRV